MKKYTATPLSYGRFLLGESPFYDPRTGIISFVGITAGKFCRIMPDSSFITFDCGQPIGAAVPSVIPGAYIFATVDGIYAFKNNSMKKIADLTGLYKPWQRSNDAKADPAGRLFFGSSSMDEAHGNNGDLFRLDKKIELLQPNTRISNSLILKTAFPTACA